MLLRWVSYLTVCVAQNAVALRPANAAVDQNTGAHVRLEQGQPRSQNGGCQISLLTVNKSHQLFLVNERQLPDRTEM